MNIHSNLLHVDDAYAFAAAGTVNRNLFALTKYFHGAALRHDIGIGEDRFLATVTIDGYRIRLSYTPGTWGDRTNIALSCEQKISAGTLDTVIASLEQAPSGMPHPEKTDSTYCVGEIDLSLCSLAQHFRKGFGVSTDFHRFQLGVRLPSEEIGWLALVHTPGDPLEATKIHASRSIRSPETIRDMSYQLLERLYLPEDRRDHTITLNLPEDPAFQELAQTLNGRELSTIKGKRPLHTNTMECVRRSVEHRLNGFR